MPQSPPRENLYLYPLVFLRVLLVLSVFPQMGHLEDGVRGVDTWAKEGRQAVMNDQMSS